MATLQAAQVITEKSNFWDFKSKYDFVDDWFLASSPYPIFLITSLYLLFVLKLGPEYLKNRKPFRLNNTLIVYNAFQVGVSIFMLVVCYDLIKKFGIFQISCIKETPETKLQLSTAIYYYFLCKISELLDTIFFVLRKKNNQVTFLHVYHHTVMVWNGWYFLKYDPGFWMVFLGTANCFVHVLMYTYYGLSAYPSLHKYLWWKKYITSLQLTQFILLLIHLTLSLLMSECKPSRVTIVNFYTNLILFIYLFSRFYSTTYSKKKNITDYDGTEVDSYNEKLSNSQKTGNLLKRGYVQRGVENTSKFKKSFNNDRNHR